MSDFALDLIIAEERRRESRKIGGSAGGGGSGGAGVDRETLVINRENFETDTAFQVKEPGVSFPIDGPGVLDTLVIACDSDQYDVFLKVDDQDVAADSFTNLKEISGELSRIAAYTDSDGNNVFAASDYQFQHEIDAAVTPQGSLTFRLQRAEIDLIRE